MITVYIFVSVLGTIPTLGVARFLGTTWQCNICGPGGHGRWPHLLLPGGHSAPTEGRPENTKNT